MSIFGVSEEQVRLIIREELELHNLDKQTRGVEATCRAAIEANAETIRANCHENSRRIAQAPQAKCIHKRLVGGRNIRIACDGSCMPKQELYREKLNTLRVHLSDLLILEAKVVSYHRDLRDLKSVTVCQHMLLIEQLDSAEKYATRLRSEFNDLINELSTLNVI